MSAEPLPNQDQSAFSFPVERGKVREFLQATLPLLHSAGLPDMGNFGDWSHAPIVFSRVADFHQPMGGSFAELTGSEPSGLRHAGHSWRSLSPMRIGQTYHVLGWHLTDTVEKRGRDGQPFRLATLERSFFDQRDDLVLQEQAIIAVLGGVREAVAVGPSAAETDNPAIKATRFNADWRTAPAATELADITTAPLGLTDIVRFAGAIGDFNPIHHDVAAARANGLPDIIAMGMFGCALASLAIEQALGEGALASLTVRFREPLPVRRHLRLRATAATAADGTPIVMVEGTSGQTPILSLTASPRQV